MPTFHRHIFLILALSAIFWSISLVSATNDLHFKDLSPTDPLQPTISTLVSKGIIRGYNDGTLRLDTPINRAEFLKILILSSFSTDQIISYSNSLHILTDIPDGHWVTPYIRIAYRLGIISGNPDGTFKAGDLITEAAALKILIKSRFPSTAIPKVVHNQAWYDPYYAVAIAQGIQPISKEWNPSHTITRREAFYLLAKTLPVTQTVQRTTSTQESTSPQNTTTDASSTQTPVSNTNTSTSSNTNSNQNLTPSQNTSPTTQTPSRSAPTIPTR